MKLKNVRTRDSVYVQSIGRSISGDLGPGEVFGSWVKFWVDKEYVDLDGVYHTRRVPLLIWGSYLGPCEVEQDDESIAEAVIRKLK